MATDPRPCRGAAYHPAWVGPSCIPTYGCDSCVNAVSQGGKCEGEDYLPCDGLGPLMESLQDLRESEL
jgi:hypothetical protein